MKYKILVVDDDKELVKMLCSYFNMKQYETITATDGMEALNKIKMKPDIILLDINMPRMDGIEVCRLIRSKVLCPILFLTARVDEDDKINGLLSGGDDYITKCVLIWMKLVALVIRLIHITQIQLQRQLHIIEEFVAVEQRKTLTNTQYLLVDNNQKVFLCSHTGYLHTQF